MIAVKQEAVRDECKLSVRESLLHIAVSMRICREACDEDLTEFFKRVGEDTFNQVNELTEDEFNMLVLNERVVSE